MTECVGRFASVATVFGLTCFNLQAIAEPHFRASLSGRGRAISGHAAVTPSPQEGGPRGACGPISLTQSTAPGTIVEGTVECISGDAAQGILCFNVENSFARSFDLATGQTSGSEVMVHCVDFGVEVNREGDPLCGGAGGSFPVTVNLYRDTDGGAPRLVGQDLQLLGTTSVTIPNGATNQFFTANFAAGVLVPANSVLVAELHMADRDPALAGDGGILFVASNGLGESAPSYTYAPQCGDPQYVTFASVGFPNVHLLLTVKLELGSSTSQGACCLADGSCLEMQSAAQCAAQLGVFKGADTQCAAVSCPIVLTCATCGGDLDASGTVNASDVDEFAAALLSATGGCADVDRDGKIDGLDVTPFIQLAMADGGAGTPCAAAGLVRCDTNASCPDGASAFCLYQVQQELVPGEPSCLNDQPLEAFESICIQCPGGGTTCPGNGAGDLQVFQLATEACSFNALLLTDSCVRCGDFGVSFKRFRPGP